MPYLAIQEKIKEKKAKRKWACKEIRPIRKKKRGEVACLLLLHFCISFIITKKQKKEREKKEKKKREKEKEKGKKKKTRERAFATFNFPMLSFSFATGGMTLSVMWERFFMLA